MEKKLNYSIEDINFSHFDQVIKLLQSVSIFFPDKDHIKDCWSKFINQENLYAVVAVIDDEVIAYGSILYGYKIRGGLVGYIEDIVVDASYQKFGIGSCLVQKLLEDSKKKGSYKVCLQCKEHNVDFYKKSGLSISGVSMQSFT